MLNTHVVTVLCHPDLRRIGEQTTLDADELKKGFSRDVPAFSHAGGTARPLEDRHLSRNPAKTNFSREQLARGVLVTVGQRVLLHVRESLEITNPIATDPTDIEAMAAPFGRALVAGLTESGREALVHRDPPWLRPETMTLVLSHPFPDGLDSVLDLAQQMARESPEDRAAI